MGYRILADLVVLAHFGFIVFVLLVGQVESSVTFRATVRVRIKARFAGNGPSLGKKRNTERL
jgi:hypothetical protein